MNVVFEITRLPNGAAGVRKTPGPGSRLGFDQTVRRCCIYSMQPFTFVADWRIS